MTFHLHLTGLVQGVGFRPFVWQLARSMELNGTVSNGIDGVHVYVNTDFETATLFRRRVLAEAPTLSRIQSARLNETEPVYYADFSIIESQSAGAVTVLLTPDLALCDACRAEIFDPANRRFGYAFTTCTTCGPRFAISHKLPYDRPATTMADFAMCDACEAEYLDPANRRFYAQTNSCPDCAVTMRLLNGSGQCVSDNQQTIVDETVALLANGQTVAVKGIGGYLLLCDATNSDAIDQLRNRKHRSAKPFALLYSSLDSIRQDCALADDETALLTGPVSPIVLLERLPAPASGVVVGRVAPHSGQLGVMLPCAPLLALISTKLGKPLVATSGNVSGSPICYTDEQAAAQLPVVADYILMHNRAIVVPQDDSVMRLSPVFRQPIVLRRSRGLAPTFVTPLTNESATVLAFGASLKSTFAWQLRGNTYVSQYLGDLESYDTQTNFRATLNHLLTLFATCPDRLLADAHEGYFSTQLARELALLWNVPLTLIQHHDAHFAAVLAENELLGGQTDVLGIIWDGTGYGTDGQIWGGEFIRFRHEFDGASFDRVTHFDYFPALLGDKMPREPRLSALSLAAGLPAADALLRPKFTQNEWALYKKLLTVSKLNTSSVGRLFDAVASLLGLTDRVSYEGEAAGMLEEQANRYVRQYGFAPARPYLSANWIIPTVPTQQIVAGVLADRIAKKSIDEIAARFHATLVAVVQTVARQQGISRVAFSGGVFQNALLADWLKHDLEPALQLHFHQQLSPNDECISFGQLAHYSLETALTLTTKTQTSDVFSHSR